MIIAVDFDGILVQDDVPFPDIGTPNSDMIDLVKDLISREYEVVLWTSRTGQALSNALTWCFYHGMEFCAVNDNAPSNKAKYESEYPQGTRKVCADLYIDDHNPEFIADRKLRGYDYAIVNLIQKIKEILYYE